MFYDRGVLNLIFCFNIFLAGVLLNASQKHKQLFFSSSLKLMIEVRLVTECSKYEEAWSKLLPQLWEHAKTTNPDCLCVNFDGSPEELEAFDDGKHFIN